MYIPFCSSLVLISDVSIFSFCKLDNINSLKPSFPTLVTYAVFPPSLATVTAVVTVSPPKYLLSVELSASVPLEVNSIRHSPNIATSIFCCSIFENPLSLSKYLLFWL